MVSVSLLIPASSAAMPYDALPSTTGVPRKFEPGRIDEPTHGLRGSNGKRK
jgi:hypothetical protein